MPEYERVPADAGAVRAARKVKDDLGENWADVFRFYAEFRGDRMSAQGGDTDIEALADKIIAQIDMTADPGTVMDGDDVEELAEQVRKLQELVERVPEDTADALGERFA